MARKPGGDLGGMAITKTAAVSTAPFSASYQSPEPTPPVLGSGSKSLTVKLKDDDYAALRTYCYEQERATGTRLTHQDAMVKALRILLDRNLEG